jgi:L-alanine-DL-glutamate epimerase-like enolase superfamily enzyme
MEITDVAARTISVPVEVPLRDEPSHVTLVFTEVETDEGVSGYGLTGGGYWWSAITSLVNKELGPAIEEQNPIETEAISAILWDGFNQRSQTGVFNEALSTIDIALWDIKGKKLGEPVWRLLGGDQNPAECYITFGLHEYTKDELVELAEELVSEFDDRVAEAPSVADQLATERLRAHREFVRERRQAGEPLEYEAINYDFPVMTEQERHVLLRGIESVTSTAEGYRVEHRPI